MTNPTSQAARDAAELKPCPFCQSADIDPEGWASIDQKGPACQDCGATAETVEIWNQRATPPDTAAQLAEAFTDDNGTVWERPTAWAYYAVCKGNVNVSQMAEVLSENERLREALVQHNDRLCSALAVANRDGRDTNWLTLRGAIQYTLAEYRDLVRKSRAALATKGDEV